MARISTYQHDAMPHADDNVIGTNQSPGHASETVLFSLSAIEQLFRGNLISVHQFTRSDYDNDFYNDLSNLIPQSSSGGSGTPDDNAMEIPPASITLTHGLQNTMPVVIVILGKQDVISDSNSVPMLATLEQLGQIPADNVADGYVIDYAPTTNGVLVPNALRITFNNRAVYSGTVVIIG